MATVEIDASELATLARDIQLGYLEAAEDARRVIARGALNIKRDWQKAWSGFAHAPHLAKAVTYDTTVSKYGIEAEIGPDKNRRQGALGNLAEYGSVNNSPKPGGGPATAAEELRLAAAMEAIRFPL